MTWRCFRSLRAAAAGVVLLLAGAAGADAARPEAAPRAEAAPAAALATVTLKLELGGEPRQPTWFALADPDRLVIDVPGARTRRTEQGGHDFVKKVRLAQHDAATARVVIDLAAPGRIQDMKLYHRTVEIVVAAAQVAPVAFRAPEAPESALLAADLVPAELRGAPPAAARRSPPRAPRSGLPLVVIDAGHGGHDVGAVSVFEGRFEKDATLAIARAIARELEKGGRVRVKLTREKDVFLPLSERVRIARAANADFFLSIHADAAPNPEASGATVYTLSDVASDRMAASVAARENRAGLVHGVELTGEDPEVAGILFSLVQRDVMNISADFAQALQRAMEPEVPFRQEFHRFAGFAVLRTGDTPAVLLETGYVTNEADARFLFSEAGQQAIARGVARGIEARFSRHVADSGAAAAGGVGRPGGNR